MTSATDTRDTLVAALEAKGLSVAVAWEGFSTPCVILEPGDPWITKQTLAPGAAQISWKVVCLADRGGAAPALTDDLAATALVAFHVLAALRWQGGQVSGLRTIPDTIGNYVAVELVATTTIDITEGS